MPLFCSAPQRRCKEQGERVPGCKRKSSGLVEDNQTLGFISQFTVGTEGCRATEAPKSGAKPKTVAFDRTHG